jgi:hypothetical protein
MRSISKMLFPGNYVNRATAVVRGRQAARCRDEAGVTLILALVFLVAISMTLLALLDLAHNDLLNTSNLQSEASLEYAADGATNAAVQWVRYGSRVTDDCGENSPYCVYLFDDTIATTPNGSPGVPAPCLPQGVLAMTLQGGGPSMAVYCVNDGEASSASSALRGVYFFGCTVSSCSVVANGTSYVCTPSGCAPGSTGYSPVLEAHLQFNDYSASDAGEESYGSQMTILSWVVEPANH